MFNVIARQSLPSPTQPFVYVDLVALIEAAAPQVYGSQERDMLQDWLLRNAGEQQIVQIPLSVVISYGWTRQNLTPGLIETIRSESR